MAFSLPLLVRGYMGVHRCAPTTFDSSLISGSTSISQLRHNLCRAQLLLIRAVARLMGGAGDRYVPSELAQAMVEASRLVEGVREWLPAPYHDLVSARMHGTSVCVPKSAEVCCRQVVCLQKVCLFSCTITAHSSARHVRADKTVCMGAACRRSSQFPLASSGQLLCCFACFACAAHTLPCAHGLVSRGNMCVR